VAGVFLLLRQPFVEGDRIRFEDDEGIVKEINFRSTVVVKETGSFLYIPNANLFTQTVENLTPLANRNRKSPIAEGQATGEEKARMREGVEARELS
jgi:small-conductance mechanosensitive channel